MAIQVRVKPAPELRRAFAQWASANKVRTVSPNEFGVPLALVPEIPERVLIGALVDSLPYVPSDRRRIPTPGGVPVVPAGRVVHHRPRLMADRGLSPATRDALSRIENSVPVPAPVEASSAVVDEVDAIEAITPAQDPAVVAEELPDELAAEPEPAAEPVAAPEPVAEVETPPATEPSDDTPAAPVADDDTFCEPCQKPFKTPGGKRSHDQQVHGTTSGEDA